MKVQVIKSFDTVKGIISEGSIVDIPESMFDRLKGKVVPLNDNKVANAILEQAVKDIQNGGVWQPTPKVRAMESEINRTCRLLMESLISLEEFTELVTQWKEAGTAFSIH